MELSYSIATFQDGTLSHDIPCTPAQDFFSVFHPAKQHIPSIHTPDTYLGGTHDVHELLSYTYLWLCNAGIHTCISSRLLSEDAAICSTDKMDPWFCISYFLLPLCLYFG